LKYLHFYEHIIMISDFWRVKMLWFQIWCQKKKLLLFYHTWCRWGL